MMSAAWGRGAVLFAASCAACGADSGSSLQRGDPNTGGATQSGGSTASAGTGSLSAAGGTTAASGGTAHSAGSTSTGPCAAAGVFACDDFDASSSVDWALWSHIGDPMRVPVIDTSVSHSGSHSLTFPETDHRGTFLAPQTGFPTSDNRFYVRAWMRTAEPMSTMADHVGFIVGAEKPENGIEVRLGASKNFESQVVMLDVNFIGDGSEHTQFSNGDVTGKGGTNAPGVELEADRWYCVEALFDGPTSEVRVWLDNTEISALHVTDWGVERTPWAPSYAVGKIGSQKYSGDPGQVWYDDVAFGTHRMGCD